jgi:hypothetical protein
MADNPYKDYGLLQALGDAHLGKYVGGMAGGDSWQHLMFPDDFAKRLYEMYPDLERRRDRNMADMAINFAGGYDWGVRESVDPQVARDMAKAYQYRDYRGGREEDSIQDYYENLAGVEAGIQHKGERLSMDDLVKAAYSYADVKNRGLLD